MEVIKYGLEPTVFVDGLCIAIDPGVDTPEEYIIYAFFFFCPTVESSESQTVMGLDGYRTGREETRTAECMGNPEDQRQWPQNSVVEGFHLLKEQ